MEMMMMMPMMMDLDDLPEQLPPPFHHPDPPLTEFSGGISTNSHHPTPPPPPPPHSHSIIHRYPPPLIMQSQHYFRSYPRGTWGQQKPESVEAMREMIFRMAALQPVQIDPESIKPPKRRNVKISKDPQSVAARHRREKISERIRILQRLVPGGTKMDTASMLDEAAHYMKFLKKQVQSLEQAAAAAGGVVTTKSSVPSQGFNVGGCGPTATANATATVTMNHHGASSQSYVVRPCGQPVTQGSHMGGSMELLR